MRTSSLVVVFLLALFAGGCLLVPQAPGGFQTLILYFELAEGLAEGEATEVHSMVFPSRVVLKGHFVRVSGRIDTSKVASAGVPSRASITVVGENRETGKSAYRVPLNASINDDGSFSVSKKLKKNIDADTLQTVTVELRDGDIPAGSRIALCVDVARKKGDLSKESDCGSTSSGPPPSGDAHVIQVLDNSFSPKSLTIQPGDTVRWVLEGAATNHTVTAMGGTFDSGFVFTSQGAIFERTFPASADGQTFEYSCETHKGCCEMQGSIRVGASAPQPSDGY